MKKLFFAILAGAFVISACSSSKEVVQIDTNKHDVYDENQKQHKKTGSASDSKLGK